MGRVLGGDSPLCRRGISRQGEGEWAGKAPAHPHVKQEVKLPLPLVTWALFPVHLDLHSHASMPAGEQPSIPDLAAWGGGGGWGGYREPGRILKGKKEKEKPRRPSNKKSPHPPSLVCFCCDDRPHEAG